MKELIERMRDRYAVIHALSEEDASTWLFAMEELARLTAENAEKDAEIERLRGIINAMPSLVPDSWLDPILTGDDAIETDATCPQIERLLNAVRDRIKQAAEAAREGGE